MRQPQFNNLRVWREQAGLTVEQLAEKLSISGASVSRIEKGAQQPRPALLRRMTRFFKKSESDFYGMGGASLEPTQIGLRRIPVWDYEQVGKWSGTESGPVSVEAREFVLSDENYAEGVFAMRVRRPSMLPKFEEGDVVLVDPTMPPRPNDCAVFKNGAGEVELALYKERGRDEKGVVIFEAVPTNDGYASWHSAREKVEIVGTVVELRKYLRR
jgi:transcriptional regulator with XRE-family HTH domain